MIIRYILVVLILFCGCARSNDFLNQFKDKGELVLENVCELCPNSTSGTFSMLKAGNYIIWNKYYPHAGAKFYTADIRGNQVSEFRNTVVEPGQYFYPEQLYECDDSTVMSFNDVSGCFSFIHLGDSLYMNGPEPVKIKNENLFSWIGKVAVYNVYPGIDSLLFIGTAGTVAKDYGVYDRKSGLLFPSFSCSQPGETDLKCLFPDQRYNVKVARQPGGSKFAVFRKYYQLFDIIEMQGNSLKLLKRSVFHHSLLTWKDQYNLKKALTYDFFPGFFIRSSEYIITLYQSAEPQGKQFLVFWDWDGKPLYSYRFPQNIRIDGICGDEAGRFYAIGRTLQHEVFLFEIKYQL